MPPLIPQTVNPGLSMDQVGYDVQKMYKCIVMHEIIDTLE